MNSELYGKTYPVPQDVLEYLDQCSKAVGEVDETTEGFKRNKDLREKGEITYQQLKRMKNWFDNFNGHQDEISHILNENDMKLSQNGIMRFDGILPPHNHENYNTALGIIAIIIKTIKSTDDLSCDDINKLVDISNNLRLILDYVLRKKIRIETKFYSTDDDISWFIWGVYSILYKEKILDDAFSLYNYEFKKKYKIQRQGIIFSLALICIYIHKKDISPGWSQKEQNVMNKIDEISIKLYNEIRRDILKKHPELIEKNSKPEIDKEKESDGLDFILNYVPEIDSDRLDNIIKDKSKNEKINEPPCERK
mgnify:CR=1 FL=1